MALMAQTSSNLRHSSHHLFPPSADSSELTVMCRREDYSASVIARAVEDADAHLLNMNVTSEVPREGYVAVDLRISHRNAGAAASSLERYGLTVTAIHSGFDAEAEVTARRIDELMANLNV